MHDSIIKMKEIHNGTAIKIQKLQNVTLDIIEKIKHLNESISILNSVTLAKTFISSLADDYDTILNAFLFAKKRLLHPRLITLLQLYNLENKTFLNTTSEKYLFDKINSFNDFTKLIPLGIFFKDYELLYVINIPFINTVKYNFYHLLHTFVNLTQSYGYTKPASTYLYTK